MQFRTKARAVDLLGKGQIADLPTAITELWKNGYDAYADKLSAELYLAGYKGIGSPIFIITDDGTGMSQDDIFNKWLVLGVDSKSRTGVQDEKGPDTLWKEPRIKAGEKGIGRLSVAFLGSPMLMLTKKQGHPLQAMYFDWRLLENYNLFLDDVEIPVTSIAVSTFRQQFTELKKLFLSNLQKGTWDPSQESLKDDIEKSSKELSIPTFFEEEIMGSFVDDNSHGTKFIIFEPEEQIIDIVDNSKKEETINDSDFVRTSLVGFVNQFKKESDRLPIKCTFLVHRYSKEAVATNFFTSSGEFFDDKDYNVADIVIDGALDGNGSFSGTLTIYGQSIEYSYTNPRRKDRRSYYGPVPIKIGYSMGKEEDSFLRSEDWMQINQKVSRYGGLYIYRDGFRVLPYGRVDADFLGLEERRNKRIGTYFFSYRRLFGYLELSRDTNTSLKDKSSREGLINNASYRVFREDLSGMFYDLAKEYFADKAANRSVFLDKKEQINARYDKVIKKDKERERQEIQAFTEALKEYPQRFKQYQAEYEKTISELAEKLKESDLIFADIEGLLLKVQQLDVLDQELLPTIPKRYKITDAQEERLYQYSQQLEEFRECVRTRWSDVIMMAKSRLHIQDLRKDFSNQCDVYVAKLKEKLTEYQDRYEVKTNKLSADIKTKSESFVYDLTAQKEKSLSKILSPNDIGQQLAELKELYNSLLEQVNDSIDSLVTHVDRLSLDMDEELLQGAYKEQYEKIKHQWEVTRETSQLGIAVEIIDHEFNAIYANINALLQSMIKTNSTDEFLSLEKNFKTLENKYKLLSPLYRISGSITKKIECAELKKFLNAFFEKRLLANNVTIQSTKDFDDHVISIKEPVLYSVCVNIINNALYWMQNSDIKTIELAYLPETEEIIIRNSGLPISDAKLEKIFGLFYSNRPNGRGLGLYLAKQSLAECHYDIYATNDEKYNTLNGACFVIKPIKYSNYEL